MRVTTLSSGHESGSDATARGAGLGMCTWGMILPTTSSSNRERCCCTWLNTAVMTPACKHAESSALETVQNLQRAHHQQGFHERVIERDRSHVGTALVRQSSVIRPEKITLNGNCAGENAVRAVAMQQAGKVREEAGTCSLDMQQLKAGHREALR